MTEINQTGNEADQSFKEQIKAIAEELIANGRTYEYIHGTWTKLHHADEYLGKALIVSSVCGCATNTKGTHIQVSGKHGSGKSDAVKKACMLMDNDHLIDSDMTPQAIFYLEDKIKPGTVISIDDMAWVGELGTTVKRCTTKFQEGATHTIVKDLDSDVKTSQKRLTFWITCVDSQADEQIRDRFLMIEVESNPEHKKAVLDLMKCHDKGIGSDKDLKFEIAVCKYIMADIHKHLFEVVIPFAERIEFEGDQRGYGIFSDMIKCLAILRYRIRPVDSQGRLMATEEDFMDAKEIYEAVGGHSIEKYTKSEFQVLEAIRSNGFHATTKEIQDITGLSSSRIGEIMNGRSQGKHGLLYKCPELSRDEKERPYVYWLSPKYASKSNTVSVGLADAA